MEQPDKLTGYYAYLALVCVLFTISWLCLKANIN
jgi:hypothetical protein